MKETRGLADSLLPTFVHGYFKRVTSSMRDRSFSGGGAVFHVV
jgi:hypothetical protein